MKISFAEPSLPDGGTLVVAAFTGRTLSPAAAALDKQTGGALGRAVAASPKFKGAADELTTLVTPPELSVARIVVIGLGEQAQAGDQALQRAGGTVAAHLNSIGETTAAIQIDGIDAKKIAPAQAAAEIAFGATLRSYRFDKYKTTQKPEAKPSLEKLTVLTADPTGARRAWARLQRVADGVAFTRDLVSEPPNILYPVSFADRAAELAELGVEVEVLDEKKLKKLGMGALLGVGQGSVHESRVVVMQWNGAPKGKDPAPVAFVGKGVTFDTGGISIKPAAGMEDMKWDMAGAGAVTGVMRALAGRKARVNAVGVIGLVENMPSGAAQRPGDIVTSMSGQTIEVLNTDAEGRLVLADALWYTQDRFKPRFMVDLATLTGAIMIALGTEYAGLFSNDDELAARLIAAGNAVGEKLWRMPLGDAYNKAIDSDAADVKNIAGDRNAGSSIGAVFLERFVNKLPWAHLDIAGMAWSKKDAPTVPKGATGYGVRLLDRLVADHYES